MFRKNKTPKLKLLATLTSVVLFPACQNDDPEQVGTFGTGGGGDSATSGGGDGADETGDPVPVCVPGNLTNPELFQCDGTGSGMMTWQQCDAPPPVGKGCPASGDFSLEIPFPDPESETNAAVCCEADAEDDPLNDACSADCARAACNEVIARLEDKLADNPCPGLQNCSDAYVETITTWLQYVQEHYDDCLTAVDTGQTFNFPEAPNLDQNQLGYAWNAQLNLSCALDSVAVSTQETCTDNENEEQGVDGVDYTCPITGTAKISGPEGTTTTPIDGVIDYTRGSCSSSPCYFEITRADLQADDVASGGYRASNMSASLAWNGFGLQESDAGTIGELMLGLDVSMIGETPSTSRQQYDFTMVNTDPASIDVRAGYLKLNGIEFSWSTGQTVVLNTNLAACTKL